ncbi:hypothetical protein CDAR_259511 [Caerostris darwini]|uniref:Uncharacterized protein n=1 Tax=Caerostris darwini TaxID=1538125 RepID=A0AAV4VP82_9ARAC|nr:hypothetical protein CDAR_259511 [Caerostris darwini]
MLRSRLLSFYQIMINAEQIERSNTYLLKLNLFYIKSDKHFYFNHEIVLQICLLINTCVIVRLTNLKEIIC